MLGSIVEFITLIKRTVLERLLSKLKRKTL
jgi:hypothetical protein